MLNKAAIALPLFILVATLIIVIISAPIWNTRLPSDDRTRPADVCRAVAEINYFDNGWLRPSPDYWDGNWLRDAFWTSGFLGPEAGRLALEKFGPDMSSEGQAPTRLGRNGAANQYYDDESTLFYVIWAARDGGQPMERVAWAWNWITRHVEEGSYWTPAGNFHTWHDTLIFPTSDVSAYNQGLYAVASLAAVWLGVANAEEAEKAGAAYRKLYNPEIGYLPVSLKLDYHDSSVLVGEALARYDYSISILEDTMVLSTVDALPKTESGFMALAARDGDYLDEDVFSPPSPPGHYQNGGSWLLYDVLAWMAAYSANGSEGALLARDRVASEVAMGTLHEYLASGPAKQMGEDVGRPDYGANAFACTITGLSDTTTALP